MDFQLLHGQCVALGCIGAVHLSVLRGFLSEEEEQAIRRTLHRFGLPVSLKGLHLNKEEILAATKKDKKMDSGRIRFILLRRIGEAYIDSTVSDQELLDTICWMSEENDE